MLCGYVRVSSADERQTVALQRDALLAAGVDERHLFVDKVSGARDDRPGLHACLAYLKQGDTLVVWKLDRLGRPLSHLLSIIRSEEHTSELQSLMRSSYAVYGSKKNTSQMSNPYALV